MTERLPYLVIFYPVPLFSLSWITRREIFDNRQYIDYNGPLDSTQQRRVL